MDPSTTEMDDLVLPLDLKLKMVQSFHLICPLHHPQLHSYLVQTRPLVDLPEELWWINYLWQGPRVLSSFQVPACTSDRHALCCEHKVWLSRGYTCLPHRIHGVATWCTSTCRIHGRAMTALRLAWLWISIEPGDSGQKIRALAPGTEVLMFGWV